MISPEMLRRYPFFAGLDHEQLAALAMMATELRVEQGRYLFHEGDVLASFYLVLEGSVAIILEVPAINVEQTVAQQLTGQLQTTAVTISNLGPGDPFGWTAVSSTRGATAGAVALSDCRVVAFDRQKLLAAFEADCAFGYRMLQQIVQVAQQRLHDMRVESLSLHDM
jgi:CRP/FNR family transcriptional regulator, cyclic AMP receptor protein